MMSEPSELVLSASSLKVWLTCGHRYLLEHVYRVPAPPNMDMAIGTAVHAGVEAAHKGENLPRLNVGLGLAAEIGKMPSVTSNEAQKASDEALAMYEVYRTKIAPDFTPTIIEQSAIVRINSVLFSGQIDAADDQGVHDTKTTATLSKFRPERHRLQMTGYRFLYRAITGHLPRRLLLDVIARNLKWKTVEIEPDEGEFVDVLTLTAQGILEGRYEPTGASSGACNRCPYSTGVCTYARLD